MIEYRDITVRLSNRQFCQLQAIRNHPRGVKLQELETYNQLTLGGNKRRQFIVETPGRDGVMLTPKGREALETFSNANFLRKIASTNFSSYINLGGYEKADEKANEARRKKGRRKAA